jgi:hypothetical protein
VLLPLIRDEEGTPGAVAPPDGSAGGTAAAAGGGAGGGAEDASSTSPRSPEEVLFTTEQNNVARLIHLFGGTTDAAIAPGSGAGTAVSSDTAATAAPGSEERDTDTDTHFAVYVVAREHLSHGGVRRVGHTFPPLVFGCLQLARRIHVKEVRRRAV